MFAQRRVYYRSAAGGRASRFQPCDVWPHLPHCSNMVPLRQITLSSCPRITHAIESDSRRARALTLSGAQRITIRTRIITNVSGSARKVLGLHTATLSAGFFRAEPPVPPVAPSS